MLLLLWSLYVLLKTIYPYYGINTSFIYICLEINPGGRSQDTGIPDETAGGFLVEFDTSLAYSAITSFTDDLRDSNDCDSAYVHTIGWDQSSSTLPLFLYRTHYVSFGTCMGNRKKLISLLNLLEESCR